MPLISTVGAANATSYVSEAEALAYFDDRIDSSAWDSTEQLLALMTACMRMETLDYVGTRATTTQALKWPRAFVPKPDSSSLYSYSYFDSTEIPKQIKDAQCEFALSLLSQSSTDPDSITSLQIGNSVRAEFDSSSAIIDTSARSGWLPAEASRLLRGFQLNPSGVAMVRS